LNNLYIKLLFFFNIYFYPKIDWSKRNNVLVVKFGCEFGVDLVVLYELVSLKTPKRMKWWKSIT